MVLRKKDVIAFGDMPNDIEMLQWAGLGVAMANADQAVKDAADIVTVSNAEAGVAHILTVVLMGTPRFIAALDQGTTSTRCVIVNHEEAFVLPRSLNISRSCRGRAGLNMMPRRFGTTRGGQCLPRWWKWMQHPKTSLP